MVCMKREVRVLGVDDCPFDKFKDRHVMVVATVFRGGSFIDGVLSTTVDVDGVDSTQRLVDLVRKCKFRSQLQVILLDGIAFGGFNIVDVKDLYKRTGIPVMTIIRRMPDIQKIKSVLRKIGQEGKIGLIDKAGKVEKIGSVYCQLVGIDKVDAGKIVRLTCTHSKIPEPLRVAHLIASGIKTGESKGRA